MAPLPSYAADRLAGLDNAELIEILIRDEDRVPRKVVDELARRGDAAVAALENRFASPEAWSADVSRGEWWLRLHAAMTFGLVPTTHAGEALIRWMRQLDAAGDDDMEEWLAGFWPALFANKPDSMLEPLRELCTDTGLGWFARWNAMEVFIATAERLGAAALEAELEWIAALAADEDEDRDTRLQAGHVLLDFPRPPHRALLEALAEHEQDIQHAFGPSDVDEAFERGRDDPKWRRFADPWKLYAPHAIEARQRRRAQQGTESP